MVNVYRMVGRLCKLVQYSDVALGDCRCGKYSCAEVLFAYYLRAGEGEEYSSGLYLLYGLCVESTVTYEGIAQAVAMFGEGGRV